MKNSSSLSFVSQGLVSKQHFFLKLQLEIPQQQSSKRISKVKVVSEIGLFLCIWPHFAREQGNLVFCLYISDRHYISGSIFVEML